MDASPRPVECDALVVGAGPVGLFQVFQLGLLEIKCHVVDALPHAGGQCVELYPDKPIYDIPSRKVVSGRELAQQLLEQIEPFGAKFHFGQEVSELARTEDGRFRIVTSRGVEFLAKVVVIAGGVGAFTPRRLKVAGIEAFEGSQVLYRMPQASTVKGRRVLVAGDEEGAVQAAISLAQEGVDVALMHRRDSFRVDEATDFRLRTLVAAGDIDLVIGQPTGFESNGSQLTALHIAMPDGSTMTRPVDTVLALLGISPRLGPIADWGLAMERKQLVVDTEAFATSELGIFAVGDMNTYPGKKKLIVCGFHECVLAAFGAAAIVYPGEKIQLQYTTTSPRLHELLGVATPHKA